MEKKMVKRIAALLVALLFCGFANAQAGKAPMPDDAVRLASSNLSRVLQWVDPGDLELYGFKKTDDFSAIYIGKPIYQNIFSMAALQGGTPETETVTILMPVWLNGTVRCFLYISPDENQQWQVVGIGGANEAKLWTPKIKSADLDGSKDQMMMMHIAQSNSDYFMTGNNDNEERYVDVSIWKNNTNGLSETSTMNVLHQEAIRLSKEASAISKEDSN